MKEKYFGAFFLTLSLLFSCSSKASDSNNSSSSNGSAIQFQNFDEEFFDGHSFSDYLNFEKYLFDTSVFATPDGLSKDDEIDYQTIHTSPFVSKQIYESSRKIAFKKRNYYSAFYLKDKLIGKNIVREYLGGSYRSIINLFDYYSNIDYVNQPYGNMVKFSNFDNLSDIAYRFDDYYLFRVVRLVDLFDGQNLLNTTYKLENIVINDSEEICFYDSKSCFTFNYDIPYNENHSTLVFYDDALFCDKNIIPYFPHPYWHSTPMVTKTEVDDNYAYAPLVYDYLPEGAELLFKDIKIRQYDYERQKSIEKVITMKYYRLLLSEIESNLGYL